MSNLALFAAILICLATSVEASTVKKKSPSAQENEASRRNMLQMQKNMQQFGMLGPAPRSMFSENQKADANPIAKQKQSTTQKNSNSF